jgi:hypothetical protein
VAIKLPVSDCTLFNELIFLSKRIWFDYLGSVNSGKCLAFVVSGKFTEFAQLWTPTSISLQFGIFLKLFHPWKYFSFRHFCEISHKPIPFITGNISVSFNSGKFPLFSHSYKSPHTTMKSYFISKQPYHMAKPPYSVRFIKDKFSEGNNPKTMPQIGTT